MYFLQFLTLVFIYVSIQFLAVRINKQYYYYYYYYYKLDND